MSAFYSKSVGDHLRTPDDVVLSALALAHARRGFTALFSDQTISWAADLQHFRKALRDLCDRRPEAQDWTIILEYAIPRKERRIDIVLLTRTKVVLLECKRTDIGLDAFEQVEHYALLLHYFHKPTDRRHIVPIAVSEKVSEQLSARARLRGSQSGLQFESLVTFWIAPTQVLSWSNLVLCLENIEEDSGCPIEPIDWLDGSYHPVPTIIDAARDLRAGLKIREIAHSEASEHDLDAVSGEIHKIVSETRASGRHAICFLTGVPGSGKTLVGLSLAHLSESREGTIHFMSGNGPLVDVLQENFRKQAMRDGVAAQLAKVQAQTLIENVHIFARTYTDDVRERAPSNHVVVFDEAQRAWDVAQNRRKFGRHYSEPDMLLTIMERHSDWAVIVALVGGGQEINTGEAGLEEWGRALNNSERDWLVYASPEVIAGGASTAGHVLFTDGTNAHPVIETPLLHLRTSNRSFRADRLAAWVNAVIEGDAKAARSLDVTSRYPIFLSRSLETTKRYMRSQALADSRYGLVGSSAAQRLRADGLEHASSFHADYPWHHWYLAPKTDVRSSYRCEVFATEFEIQGLELDWIGLCWGGDFIRTDDQWIERDLRYLSTTRWGKVKRADRQQYRRNAYRVLLTRARQGMVLFVPKGDPDDPTRCPDELDQTAAFLQECGVTPL